MEKNISRWFFVEWASTLTVFVICFLFLYNQIQKLDDKVQRQADRTDRLYEMFIDLLKEGKNK